MCASAQIDEAHAHMLCTSEKPFHVRAIENRLTEVTMNRNQVKGRVRQQTGQIRQMIGKLFGNKRMQAQGGVEKAGGKIQSGYGDATDSTKKHT